MHWGEKVLVAEAEPLAGSQVSTAAGGWHLQVPEAWQDCQPDSYTYSDSPTLHAQVRAEQTGLRE